MRIFIRPLTVLLLLAAAFGLLSVDHPPTARAALGDYITNIPQPVPVSPDTADIQQKLEAHVREMIDLGHLAPTLYFIGLEGNPVMFYATPSETIYTLSAAYPYLSGDLQAAVKTYLDNELNLYPPHQTGYFGPNAGKVSDLVGQPREYYVQNPDQSFNYWPGIEVNPSVLYALWLYSHNTGDWSYVAAHYSSLKSIFNSAKSDNQITSYPELSGVIGFARIVQHLNHTGDYTQASAFAESGFAAAANFDQFLAGARQRYPNQPANGLGYTSPVFLFHRDENHTTVVAAHFDRDVGRFLQNNSRIAVANYSNQIAQEINLWWLTDVAMTFGENAYVTPEVGWSNFMLRAYVLNDSTQTLKKFLDAPTRRGDLFYIQKLVAVIEQGAGVPSFTVNSVLYLPLIAK
ncbi:MAG: hypothetical protein D6768_17920 [Chloroflexi bacterium]|nr:MAG: hypothetical protein D6768_17920 [Chloroflexota bacterium]